MQNFYSDPVVDSMGASTQDDMQMPAPPASPVQCATKVVNNAVTGVPDVVADSLPSRYKAPLDSAQQELLSRKTFSENTNAKINWAVNLYRDWYFERCKSHNCDSRIQWSNLEAQEISKANLAYALSCFLSEVRKRDGSEYPGDTLYQLVVCIQFFLECSGCHWKLIDGEEFIPLKFTLDNLMKECAAMGLGKRKSSSPISVLDENSLWDKGVLGTNTPDTLRDTLLFLLGLHLALQGGKEHKDLRAPGFDSQLSVRKDDDRVKFLQFEEDLQRKTNQGGHNSRKKAQGCVMKVYSHPHPERNVVVIFEKYVSLLPVNGKNSSLYKHSLPKFSLKANQWYADKPVGINVLKKTVKKLAELGGLEGCFTNHSLRSSCTTRMDNAGVDEQLIMETTSHKSECVRQYKRTSEELLHAAQETVSHMPPSKKVKTSPTCTESKPPDTTEGYGSDIIEVDENEWFDSNVMKKDDETVSYIVNEDRKCSRAHKNLCPQEKQTGACSNLCGVLKTLNQKTEYKKKKARLSLKFVKTKKVTAKGK